jgi:hypothetical protein
MVIKPQRPSDNPAGPGFFYPFRIGNNQGGQDYKNSITSCNPAITYVGVPYAPENGNMVGPTRQGIDELIATDPNATWVPPVYTNGVLNSGTGIVTGSTSTNWTDSPRVIKVALFDPNQILTQNGQTPITFNNIALLFLEGFQGNGTQAPLVARFLYYAQGTGGGPVTGPLVKLLRLVE